MGKRNRHQSSAAGGHSIGTIFHCLYFHICAARSTPFHSILRQTEAVEPARLPSCPRSQRSSQLLSRLRRLAKRSPQLLPPAARGCSAQRIRRWCRLWSNFCSTFCSTFFVCSTPYAIAPLQSNADNIDTLLKSPYSNLKCKTVSCFLSTSGALF